MTAVLNHFITNSVYWQQNVKSIAVLKSSSPLCLELMAVPVVSDVKYIIPLLTHWSLRFGANGMWVMYRFLQDQCGLMMLQGPFLIFIIWTTKPKRKVRRLQNHWFTCTCCAEDMNVLHIVKVSCKNVIMYSRDTWEFTASFNLAVKHTYFNNSWQIGKLYHVIQA